MPNATGLPALLLLALAGGFAFAAIYERTRYQVLRAEGQQLYFYAAIYAIALVFLSRTSLWIASDVVSRPFKKWVVGGWDRFLGPLDVPAANTFIGAFVLGVGGAYLLNLLTDQEKTASKVIEEHGSQLEQFLYESMLEARLLFVALDNRKLYIGWPTMLPQLKPHRDGTRKHFGLLPARSGYLDEKTLHPKFTSRYGPIYVRILKSQDDPITDELDMTDFEIMLPLDRIMVIRPYSLDVSQEEFLISPEDEGFLLPPQDDTAEARN